jgi:DNA-binding Lrp family transcriptional regulator
MGYSGSCVEKLISLYKAIQGCLKTISQEYEFTVPEMMIMLELYENKALSLNELSEKMEFPKSSVSRIVDNLVNRGYVSREIPKENRRMVELSISSQVCLDGGCIGDKFNAAVIEGLEPEDVNRMISHMEEISLFLKTCKARNE